MVEDGLFEITFLKEKDVSIVLSSGASVRLPPCFIMGKPPAPYKLLARSTLTMFTVKLQPWVASFFFPFDHFQVLDLETSYGPEIMALQRRIFQGTDFITILNLVESFLQNVPKPAPASYHISKAICEEIYSQQGRIKVKELLQGHPHSRQRLNHLFAQQTKCAIKEFSIYCRIREVIAYKIQHPETSLTEAAYQFDYFDQSHFIKDFKKATGVSPTQFLTSSNLYGVQLSQQA